MDAITSGLLESLSLANICYVFIGVTLGNIIGAIPGLNSMMAIAIAVPITFYMPTVGAIGFLVGINKGGAFGGSISAILMNIPGTPDAAATCFDGYPMHKQGKGVKALKISLYASVFGDTFSTILLIIVAAPIARVALHLGSAELCALMIFALTLIADLESENICKGVIAAAAGLLVSTIGLEPVSSQPRLTFGLYQLENGIPLGAISIGLLAMSEILMHIREYKGLDPTALRDAAVGARKKENSLPLAECIRMLPTLVRASLVGVFAGIMPGIGGTVSAFLSYGIEKKQSKQPEEFGKGKAEGIAAPEAANNAVIGANLIPLFTLGIPGSVSSALLIGAFIIHGITPGPMMFQTHPATIYGIYGTMMLGNLLSLFIGYAGLHLFIRVLSIPKRILYPTILYICLVGAYVADSTMTAVLISLIFMATGYAMKRLNFSFVSFIIGFVLGPSLELTMQQTIISGLGSPVLLFTRPVACFFMLLTAFVVLRKTFLFLRESGFLQKHPGRAEKN